MSNRFTFPNKLFSDALKEAEQTEESLADTIGISRSYLNHIKNGRRQLSRTIAQELSRILNVPIEEWFKSNSLNTKEELLEYWHDLKPSIITQSQILQAVETRLLQVEGFSPERLHYCTYNLRNNLADSHFMNQTSTIDSNEITIKSGDTINLRSIERFTMPTRLTGQISPTREALNMGLTVDTGSAVHPTWEGEIEFRVTNISDTDVELDSKTKLARIEFFFLSEDCRTASGQAQQDSNNAEDERSIAEMSKAELHELMLKIQKRLDELD